MNIDKIEIGIEKTGYRLEFDISTILSNSGWNVINNKYYVDDQQEAVREIDIVAYKATLVNDIYVYTALIISCKKSEKNAWALLAKNPDPNDSNTEWLPVHAWSNDRILSLMLSDQDWKDSYISISGKNGCKIVSERPEKHIFAFQEMNLESGSPQNDKNIFNSITSLMKAQAYEMSALPLRKKDPCVFQFNLLSIMKTELVRLDFSSSRAKGVSVDEEVYVAGYIVNKQQTYAKIHFIKANEFKKILNQYNALHDSNIESFSYLYSKFLEDIRKDHKKMNIFKKDIASDIWWLIYNKLKNESGIKKLIEEGWLEWNDDNEDIELQISLSEEQISVLNSDKNLIRGLSKALHKYYRYIGDCRFAIKDIPF